MKTTIKTLLALLLSLGTLAPVAHAAPGDAESDPPGLTVIGLPATTCPIKGALCLRPAAPSTQSVGTLTATLGPDGMLWDPPKFTRVFAKNAPASAPDLVPWTVEVNARLRRPALAGNTVFVLTDVDDPEQNVTTGVVTAAFQAHVPAGDRLAAQLRLGADDGFRPGHTYRLRVVQIVEGAEVELASGELRLL